MLRTERLTDLRHLAYSVLKEVPVEAVRERYMRKYYTHSRRYRHVDVDQLIAELPPNAVVVDFGANEGVFTALFADIAAEIHAFEPDPLIFEHLQKNYGAHPNITLYNAAIGPEDGEVPFFRDIDFVMEEPTRNSLGSSLFSDHEKVQNTAAVHVKQIGIVSFLENLGRPVDLMKMDIEGAEVPVLETLLDSPVLDRVSKLVVETHEHVLPNLVRRTHALRKRVKKLKRPIIDMNWL